MVITEASRSIICLDCKHSFSSQRRSDKLQQIIFNHYFYHRQTAQELALKYHRSERWIREQIHAYKVTIKQRTPREVALVMDATFFGKRIDKFGLIVAKDIKTLEPISYHFIQTENLAEYSRLKSSILSQGFRIQSITIDGKHGLFSLFANIPVQMCYFHQQAIIARYLTRKPKLKASIDLKRITGYLGDCNRRIFLTKINNTFQFFYTRESPAVTIRDKLLL